MQSWCAGGVFLPSRKPDPPSTVPPWLYSSGQSRRLAIRAGANGGEQDHYAVLGIPRTASTADVKRAYRLLARKYHPDVSRELRAAEVFKSIRSAYEVLFDEATRAKYDRRLRFHGGLNEPWSGRRTYNDESDERRRMRRWAANMRQRMQYEEQSRGASWYDQRDAYHEKSGYERGYFLQAVQFTFITLFFMRIVGPQITLAFCGLASCLDNHLDAGYKMGYIFGWIMGGRGGVLLALCIYFASSVLGKKSSSLVAVVVLAMWVTANVTRFTALPHGAVLALLYMSIKLQSDLK